MEAIALGLEATALREEAIASRLEAVASSRYLVGGHASTYWKLLGLETIAVRMEAIDQVGGHCYSVGGHRN